MTKKVEGKIAVMHRRHRKEWVVSAQSRQRDGSYVFITAAARSELDEPWSNRQQCLWRQGRTSPNSPTLIVLRDVSKVKAESILLLFFFFFFFFFFLRMTAWRIAL